MNSIHNLCAAPLNSYTPSWNRRDYDLEKIQDARENARHSLGMARYCRTETGAEARRAEVVWISRARGWRKFANALACRRKARKERGDA